jgi:hypothetical protein
MNQKQRRAALKKAHSDFYEEYVKHLPCKAAKTDIGSIEYLLADLDPRHDETSEAAKDRYLTALNSFIPAPSAIIDSGNGIQCLWKLKESIELPEATEKDDKGKPKYDEATLKLIEGIELRSTALMQRLGSVAGTQNIDRILRLPGTTNLPNKKKLEAGRVSCPTKLVRFNGAVYPIGEFPQPEPQTETASKQPEQATHARRMRYSTSLVPGCGS